MGSFLQPRGDLSGDEASKLGMKNEADEVEKFVQVFRILYLTIILLGGWFSEYTVGFTFFGVRTVTAHYYTK